MNNLLEDFLGDIFLRLVYKNSFLIVSNKIIYENM